MIISNHMKAEHRECDTLFASAEEAIALGEWSEANTRFLDFANKLYNDTQKNEITIV